MASGKRIAGRTIVRTKTYVRTSTCGERVRGIEFLELDDGSLLYPYVEETETGVYVVTLQRIFPK